MIMIITCVSVMASCNNGTETDTTDTGTETGTSAADTPKVKVYTEYDLTSEKYAFAVSKENTALKEAANELLAELKANGKLEEIINAFFDGSAEFTYTNPVSAVPSGDERDDYLVVATNAYFPPFEHYQGNKISGIDMQIGYLLAEKLGKTLYIYDMEFDSVIISVKNGQADIGMAGMTVNEERLKTVDFTSEYYESAQVLVVRGDDTVFADCKSAEDIVAKIGEQKSSFKVGAQNGTTGYMYSAGDEGFGYDGFKNLTTTGYTTGALAIRDLANKKIDAVIIDKQPAIMIAASTNK